MSRSDINPRALPAFERRVLELLEQIVRKLDSIEQQLPDPRGLPDYSNRH